MYHYANHNLYKIFSFIGARFEVISTRKANVKTVGGVSQFDKIIITQFSGWSCKKVLGDVKLRLAWSA